MVITTFGVVNVVDLDFVVLQVPDMAPQMVALVGQIVNVASVVTFHEVKMDKLVVAKEECVDRVNSVVEMLLVLDTVDFVKVYIVAEANFQVVKRDVGVVLKV